MAESMIERVARAICEADMEAFDGMEELYLAQARAAIEAMREPTEAMTFAGMRAAEKVGGAISSTEVNSVLTAFIDAALNEQVAG